jgi:hypothetical protein
MNPDAKAQPRRREDAKTDAKENYNEISFFAFSFAPSRLRGLIYPICVYLCSSVAIFSLAGCGGKPNAANIELRKQNQQLRDEVSDLQQARQADAAAIASLESNATTVPVLPSERVEPLFTVHGLQFGRLTGGADLDRDTPGDEGVKVYIVPVDRDGDTLKAAGAFTVELFDLNRQENQKIGQWSFPVEDARKNWYGRALLNTYVLTCPWQTPPEHGNLTLKVTFVDELTRRQFDAQREITVQPPATQPATQ